MADTKISALTADTAPTKDDLVVTVNDPAGSPANRKVTLENLLKFLTGLTANSTPAATDILALIDDPGGTPAAQKITIGDLLTFKETIPIPVEWANDGAAPPADASDLTSTNTIRIRDFDPASDEDIKIPWQVPADLVGAVINFRVICYVSNATGPSNEGWAFFLQGMSLGDGDILSSAMGAAVKSSITGRTDSQYDRVATAWSGDVTITDLLAGETAHLKLYRDVSDADDDYAQDIGVAFLEIKYTRKLSYS